MTDTDMLYMATIEKRNAELEARIAELEDKHHNECGQIAHYSDELREYTREHTERVWVMKSDVLDLITEAYEDGGFKDYSDYDSLWNAVDDM